MSNIATAMIKKTEAAIFVEFPGHDSYETVMKTITRGGSEKAQGKFKFSLIQVRLNGSTSGETPRQTKDSNVDVKEQLMFHAYQDLLDFILDFQQT